MEGSGWPVHRGSVGVFVAGAVLTALLCVAAFDVHNSNENHLLAQRTREAAAVLTTSVAGIQAPLSSAAELAEATDGATGPLQLLMGPVVASGQSFVSTSLWKADGSDLKPVAVVGRQPLHASQSPATIRAFLRQSTQSPRLAVFALLTGPTPTIGYSAISTRAHPTYVAYGERVLPKNRTSVIRQGDAFSGLASAVYLGHRETQRSLLTATTADLPLRGRRSSATIPVGNTSLELVMSPVGELGGTLLAWLPWLILAVGAVMTIGASALVERLLRRRDEAQQLAGENEALYSEQRTVAQTLQRSLLPHVLPSISGLEFAALYEPGAGDGADIGGDWYDAMAIDDQHVMFAIGDVSGRGLDAATLMAAIRYSVRAFASQGHDPASILTKLGDVVALERDGHFATMLCGIADTGRHTISVANAGHPPPILMGGDEARFIPTTVGVPVGVEIGSSYQVDTFDLDVGTTMLLYTDGLFERRGETLDVGLERLRDAAGSVPQDQALTDRLDTIRGDLAEQDTADDTAMLGVQWAR